MGNVYDMIVIGGGPGGYTSALYGARAGLRVLVLERLAVGGQMALTPLIENYPGFPEGVDGYTLGEQMRQSAEQFGAETRLAEVTGLELRDELKMVDTGEDRFYGRTVVIATGAGPRMLGLDREEELTGNGVSYCAHCDGMFYRGKTVMVVGGGNSAVADALILSRIAEKVILVHRRDTLRATKVYHQSLMEAKNVQILWNSAVVELLGEGRLTGAVVEDLVSKERTQVDLDGAFVSIGRKPASELVAGVLPLDEGGYVIADGSTKTQIPGVYAVGDVRTTHLRQIVTAVADGAVAAEMAGQYLAEK
ncbi:MAG: thioredoxin-disulfide reductase [Oscillospiraceae bacterium]|nr:thioredoxin-disulfide reductase [Oscillospiraceae bacterium]